MPTGEERAHGSLREIFFGSPVRAERQEKVLRYIVHRTNEGAPLHDVVGEDYVRRNCSQGEIDGIVNDPELVHACRERLWRTFESDELDPDAVAKAPTAGARRRLPEGEDGGDFPGPAVA